MPDPDARRPAPPSAVERLRAARRPLQPAPGPPAGPWRAWAAAACAAEAAHGRADFWRAVHALGLAARFDRDDGWGGHERACLLAHEALAEAALLWLSHLQAHEADRRGPWAVLRWETGSEATRRRWWARRRELWAGFVAQVRRYRAARQAHDAGRRAA